MIARSCEWLVVTHEEDQRSVLQFTRLDSFLVRGVGIGLGPSLHARNLLGVTSAVLREHNITGGSCRLYCQLGKEPNPSLWHYRAALSHCGNLVFAFRRTDH